MRKVTTVTLLALLVVTGNAVAHAQEPPSKPMIDSARAIADSARARPTRLHPVVPDTAEEAEPAHASLITAGMSVGSLAYAGGRTEHAVSASVRLHPLPWMSLGASPTFARSREPTAIAARPDFIASGLTDVPIDLAFEYQPPIAMSPGLRLAFDATLPTGDTTTGLGVGRTGTGASIDLSLTPVERLSLHAGTGRSLSGISTQSGFNGTASLWGDVSLALQLSSRVSGSLGYDGDVGTVDPAYGRSASMSVGFAAQLAGSTSLTMNGSFGLSGAVPLRSFQIGMGTDVAGIAQVAFKSPIQRLRQSFGAGRHGLPKQKGSASPGRKRIRSGTA